MQTQQQAKSILLVDDEGDLVWSLRSRLSKLLPGVLVEGTSNAEEATRWLEKKDYDVVVSDIRMPQMSGIELLIQARRRRPSLPFIVMTAFPSAEGQQEVMQLGSVTYIEKPFPVEHLLAALQKQLSEQVSGFSGAMQLETLPDLVQLFSLSNMTGALRIRRDGTEGVLWFDRGAIVHAVTGPRTGVDAFHEILGWAGGRFDLERHTQLPDRTIFEGTTALLLESLRRQDEARNEGGLEVVLEDGLTLESPAYDALASESEAFGAALSQLRGLSGYLGSCAVDCDIRQIIACDVRSSAIDVAAAGVANIDVISAKRRTIDQLAIDSVIDDIIITVSSQYHLLRPIEGRPSIFLYLVVDRPLATLGTARFVLRNVERQLAR